MLHNILFELRAALTACVLFAPFILPPLLTLIISFAICLRSRSELLVWIVNPLTTAAVGPTSFLVLFRLSHMAFRALQGPAHGNTFAAGPSVHFVSRFAGWFFLALGLFVGLAVATASADMRRNRNQKKGA